MAKEVLSISEERVGELVRIIRAGLQTLPITEELYAPEPGKVRRETMMLLEAWCREEERYVRTTMSKPYWP